MSRTWLNQLVILFYFGQCCSSLETRNVKAITNTDFKDVKVTEIPLETLMVRSKMECIVACRKSSSCLSFTFNDDSKDCYLFSQDFVHVADTQTIDEKGWNYYYLVAGINIDKSTCTLSTLGICKGYCFFYKNVLDLHVPGFGKICSNGGGEVIKVDRYLKQHCMGQAIDPIIGTGALVVNGIQDETTGEWTHFDGMKMKYFYWDDEFSPPQPNYKSAETTPGEYEGILTTRKRYKYKWHDSEAFKVTVVLCEIR